MAWPATSEALIAEQGRLSAAAPEAVRLHEVDPAPAGCFVCFERGGSGQGNFGDLGWAAAAIVADDHVAAVAVVQGEAGAAYRAGQLALREGPMLEAALAALPMVPTVVVVNATGRDHPRGAGLALHLGAVVGLPSMGVTHRPLLAKGEWPRLDRGARASVRIDGEVVGEWVCTRSRARPLVVHPGWRVDQDTAFDLVMASTGSFRTPEPIRRARQAARRARANGSVESET